MESLKDRQLGDSSNHVSGRLGGRGNRTPQGGLVHLALTLTGQLIGYRNQAGDADLNLPVIRHDPRPGLS